MNAIFICAAVFCLGAVQSEVKARFDNYRVYSLDVQNEYQLNILNELSNNPNGFEFWRGASHVGRNADIMVAPHQIATFDELVRSIDIKSRLMVENIQS